MSKVPRIIYLQADEDDWELHYETTWCRDKIDDTDVMYYHAETVKDILREIGSNYGIKNILCGFTKRMNNKVKELSELRQSDIAQMEFPTSQ